MAIGAIACAIAVCVPGADWIQRLTTGANAISSAAASASSNIQRCRSGDRVTPRF